MEQMTNEQIYMRDIAKYPLLTKQEELELATKAIQGDDLARTKLINSNLRLVVSITKDFLNKGLGFLDLVQHGNEGLIKCIDRYDPKSGNRFSTFATYAIKEAMRRGIENEARLIRIPVYLSKRYKEMRKAASQYENEFGKEPTNFELSNYMNGKYTVEQIEDAYDAHKFTLSLDAPVYKDNEKTTLGDYIDENTAFEEYEEEDDFTAEVNERLSMLDSKEKHIIELIFGLNGSCSHTSSEVAAQLNCSRQNVEAIYKRAILKMKP